MTKHGERAGPMTIYRKCPKCLEYFPQKLHENGKIVFECQKCGYYEVIHDPYNEMDPGVYI